MGAWGRGARASSDYPIASVATGQFTERGEVWVAEFALDGGAVSSPHRPLARVADGRAYGATISPDTFFL